MNFIPTSTPFGHSIFCDDVRTEANGKQMHIGVYLADMLFQTAAFPVRLPSLHVIVHYLERRGDSDKNVRLAVFIPGKEEPLTSYELQRSDLDAVPMPTATEGLEDPMVGFNFVFQLHDLVFTEPGYIKVRAFLGDDVLRLGALSVRLVPPPPPAPEQIRTPAESA